MLESYAMSYTVADTRADKSFFEARVYMNNIRKYIIENYFSKWMLCPKGPKLDPPFQNTSFFLKM